MNDTPIELDKHRGMAAQKATDIRRVVADVETKAKLLRDHQNEVEIQLMAAPAASWVEAAAKARYVLNLYAAQLPPAVLYWFLESSGTGCTPCQANLAVHLQKL